MLIYGSGNKIKLGFHCVKPKMIVILSFQYYFRESFKRFYLSRAAMVRFLNAI